MLHAQSLVIQLVRQIAVAYILAHLRLSFAYISGGSYSSSSFSGLVGVTAYERTGS